MRCTYLGQTGHVRVLSVVEVKNGIRLHAGDGGGGDGERERERVGEGEGEALAADGLGEDVGFVVSVVEVVISIFPSLCFVLSNLPY